MAIQSHRVQVGTQRTRLDLIPDNYLSGQEVMIRPASDIFIGGDNVTTANGFRVEGGSEFSMTLRDGDDLYGIAAAGPIEVEVLQSGV